jgi:hypothetical protein
MASTFSGHLKASKSFVTFAALYPKHAGAEGYSKMFCYLRVVDDVRRVIQEFASMVY